MDVEYLREGLDLLLYVGQILTPEEQILIKNSLIILQSENKLRQIFFWGRIQGVDKDYFIAYGYTRDCLRERKFFYSLDCFQWLFLAAPNPDYMEATIICPKKFTGDPYRYTCIDMDPTFTIDENLIILATEPVIIRLKEEDRLSCAVFLITEESAVVPTGALYQMTDMSVIYNPMFHGLNELQANVRNCYRVYRVPRNTVESNWIKRSDYNYAIDFLDTIDDILPKELAFNLNVERNGRLVIIRSCVWPGMTFFHKLHSHRHGFVYFGDGKKNFDLLFMI